MKTVPVWEAEGMVLCHDLTQIIPGEFKGSAFRKGHIIRREDIPRLLDMRPEMEYFSATPRKERCSLPRLTPGFSRSTWDFSTR